jgi:purine-binding chemotaxis protein CheW
MNLSEIRKKAQQERIDGQPQESVVPRQPISAADVSVAPRLPQPVTTVVSPEPITAPAALSAPTVMPNFDPASLIIAGRQESLLEYVNESSITQSASDEEDFEECLCFRVAAERYAINIMEIKEITKPREMTEVPRVPDFVSGVISLRGVIVPIFDLKVRLHLAPVPDMGKTRIIVVKNGEDLFGILVDEVIQVVKVPAKTIEQPPAVLEGIDREFVRGIGRHEQRMLILLHLGKILDLSLT